MADVGRPRDYDVNYHPQKVLKLCLLGLTDEQMAGALEIAVSTFYKWQIDFPEFSEAIKKGKIDADANVAASLYRKAIGFKETVKKPFKLKETTNGKGSTERVEVVDVEEYYPPDTGAGIWWLRNRHPKLWREEKKVEIENKGPIDYSKLSDDTIRELLDAGDTDAGQNGDKS